MSTLLILTISAYHQTLAMRPSTAYSDFPLLTSSLFLGLGPHFHLFPLTFFLCQTKRWSYARLPFLGLVCQWCILFPLNRLFAISLGRIFPARQAWQRWNLAETRSQVSLQAPCLISAYHGIKLCLFTLHQFVASNALLWGQQRFRGNQ